jgi:hypothetical protein
VPVHHRVVVDVPGLPVARSRRADHLIMKGEGLWHSARDWEVRRRVGIAEQDVGLDSVDDLAGNTSSITCSYEMKKTGV